MAASYPIPIPSLENRGSMAPALVWSSFSICWHGWSEAQILDSYPQVKQEDVEAVFAFVRDCMKDETFIMQAVADSGQVPA